MGIKGLNTLLKKFSKESIITQDLHNFKNQTIAIDISIYAYRFLYNDGNIYSKFLQQLSMLIGNNIQPIYIFDGKPPVQKKETLDTRKELKKKKIMLKNQKLEELKKPDLTDLEFFTLQNDIDKIEKSLISVTPEIIKGIKEMFDLLGVNYIQADGEADTVCCQLYKDGKVTGSLSEDFDLLLRGSGILMTDFDYKKETIVTYNLNSILRNLSLDHNEFIDLGILCGCDYTSKITGIGPFTALKLIKKYKNIENIIEKWCNTKKNIVIPSDFDYIKARNMMTVPINEFKDYRYTRIFTNKKKEFIENWLRDKDIKKEVLKRTLYNIIPKTHEYKSKKVNTLHNYFTVKK